MRIPAAAIGVLAAILAVAVVAAPSFGTQATEQDLDVWAEKVELVMTEDEADRWEDLESASERRAFVEEFWSRRDPTPETERNEYRDVYLERVRFAEENLGESGVPGYKTALGRVFIVYGPPKAQETRRNLRDQSGVSDMGAGGQGSGGRIGGGAEVSEGSQGRARPDIIWTYEGEHPRLEEDQEVRFSASPGSPYVIRTDLELSHDAFMDSLRTVAARQVAEQSGGGSSATTSQEASTASQDPTAQQGDGPSVARLLDDLAQGAEPMTGLAVQRRFDFFPAPQGATFTAVVFELEKADLTFQEPAAAAGEQGVAAGEQGAGETASLEVFGRLVQAEGDNAGTVVHDFSVPLTVAADDGTPTETAAHSVGIPVNPGSYDLLWGITDQGSGATATMRDRVEAPNFAAGRLGFTSILVAQGMEQKTDPVQIEKVYSGIRLGNVQIQVDLDRVYERDQTIELLYFVIGAQPDPSSQRPSLTASHRVLRADDEESIARLPEQTLDYAAIGQQIPLGQIEQIEPGNDYLVEIEVTDEVSGESITETVPFTVAGEEAPAEEGGEEEGDQG